MFAVYIFLGQGLKTLQLSSEQMMIWPIEMEKLGWLDIVLQGKRFLMLSIKF